MYMRLALFALSLDVFACGCHDVRVKPASTLEPDSALSAELGAGPRVISNAERLEIVPQRRCADRWLLRGRVEARQPAPSQPSEFARGLFGTPRLQWPSRLVPPDCRRSRREAIGRRRDSRRRYHRHGREIFTGGFVPTTQPYSCSGFHRGVGSCGNVPGTA